MFATIRRYDAIDQERTAEVVKKVDETLVPSLKELPRLQRLLRHQGRRRHPELNRLLRHGRARQQVTRVATNWVREQQLEEGTPERAEGHLRRGRGAEDGRAG